MANTIREPISPRVSWENHPKNKYICPYCSEVYESILTVNPLYCGFCKKPNPITKSREKKR